MNLFQLVLKQMRQRALSTWLTLLSVTLGVALAVAILILFREGRNIFGQTDYGYDVLVGKDGSPLQLVLNSAYHLDRSPGNVPYSVYEALGRSSKYRPMVRQAVPFAVGDTYKGRRIVGTLPKLFGVGDEGQALDPEFVLEYRPGKRYAIAQGRVFARDKFEAVIGADVTKLTGLKIGDTFQATHGNPSADQNPDIHPEAWTVVGILEPTRTANDGVVFIPLVSFYTIEEHEEALIDHAKLREQTALPTIGHAHDDHAHQDEAGSHDHHDHEHGRGYTLREDGTIDLELPRSAWEISAVLVRTRSPIMNQRLMYDINNAGTGVMAVNPASVMRQFFEIFLAPSRAVLLAICVLVTVVAAVSILVSIYNSVAARKKEIAILRALGATRTRILALICVEAAVVGLVGGILGLIIGHLLAGIGSMFMQRFVGEGINWLATSGGEWLYLLGVVILATLAGLVPARLAYRTPVASNLVSGS